MLARPRNWADEKTGTRLLAANMTDPLNACTVASLTPPVDRASYLAARVTTFTDTVKRGVAELASHAAPI